MQKRSILSRLFGLQTKGLADPSADLFALFGVTTTASGVAISADAALRVPAVGSAIRLISEAVASLDVMVKEVAADGTEKTVHDHPARAFLADAANDWTSGYELIRDLVIDGLTDDRGGLAYVNRTASGEIAELIRYRSGLINVDISQNTGQPIYRLENVLTDPANIIHFREPFGRAPLNLAREAIAVAFLLEQHAANLFSNGARPGGVLMFPKGMGEAAVKAAISAWQKTHGPGGSSGGTAILYDGAEFKPHAFTSTDAQFLENRKFQILEVARCFRVPPSMLFDLDRATWGNTEQMGREFLVYCLEPRLRALEGALRRALFSPADQGRFAIRFDRDDLTRADLQTRATTINSLIATKVINPNEGREWIGLGPREGGEVFENPNITTTPAKPDQGGNVGP